MYITVYVVFLLKLVNALDGFKKLQICSKSLF